MSQIKDKKQAIFGVNEDCVISFKVLSGKHKQKGMKKTHSCHFSRKKGWVLKSLALILAKNCNQNVQHHSSVFSVKNNNIVTNLRMIF